MPSLLDLEQFLASDQFKTPPLLHITMPIPLENEDCFQCISDGLLKLPEDRLELWSDGKFEVHSREHRL
jgi:hypothetical protein